jgi:hypothetical protein
VTDVEKSLYGLILTVILLFSFSGILYQGLSETWAGFLLLQQHPGRLINDYTAIGGTGAAFLNAAVTGAMTLILIRISSVRLSGPTIAAVFTIMGFSLFGKTPVNIAPIFLGVFIAALLVKKPFRSYSLIAFFGSALGPLVTYLTFEAGFTGIPALLVGFFGGVTVGIILPSLAMAMLKMHEGYNLYNIGLTCGFFALFAAALLTAANRDLSVTVIWNSDASWLLISLVPAVSLLFIVWGGVMDGPREGIKGMKKIFSLSGRLPSDFIEMVSPGASLVNAGVLGLLGSAYILVVGGDFNGPTIGGLFTVIGFATFGKHLKNTIPVAIGVVAATLLFGKSLTAPGPILALLFGTTLAPLAGEFVPFIGIIAGFFHLLIVERTAAWHGGLDLYNNGFAGGLVATLIVAIIEWVRSNKQSTT